MKPKIGRWYRDIKFNDEYLMPLSYKTRKTPSGIGTWNFVYNKITIISSLPEEGDSVEFNYVVTDDDIWFDGHHDPILMPIKFSIKLPSKTKRKAIRELFKGFI